MKNLFNVVLLLGSVTCLPVLANGDLDSEEDIVEVPTLAPVEMKFENKDVSEHPAITGRWSKYYGFADDTTFMGESLEDEQTQKLAKSFDMYAKAYYESKKLGAKIIEYNEVISQLHAAMELLPKNSEPFDHALTELDRALDARPRIVEAMERLAQDPQLFDQVVVELYNTMKEIVENDTKPIRWAGRGFQPNKVLIDPDAHLPFKHAYELFKRFADFKGIESQKLEQYDFRRLITPQKILQHYPLPGDGGPSRMHECKKIYQQIREDVANQNYGNLRELMAKLREANKKERGLSRMIIFYESFMVVGVLQALVSAQELQS